MVGLAIARELGLAGRQVLVLDSGPAIGTQTSNRNSEVIHSGGMHYGQSYHRGIVSSCMSCQVEFQRTLGGDR